MRSRRKLFASVALLAGVFLLVSETLVGWADRFAGNWFWLLVAVLVTVFAIVELAAKPPPPKPPL